MPDLFGLDIAGIVRDAITGAGGLRPATLIKVTPGTRTALALAGGTNPTQASYTTQGILEIRTVHDAGDMTRRQKAVITLLGKPLTESSVAPEAGDRVTLEGATYDVTEVQRDPAAATYTCTVVGA